MSLRHLLPPLFSLALLLPDLCLAQSYPRRVSTLFPTTDLKNTKPYSSVGLVRTIVGGKPYWGSAAIALDKRLIFTCAHVLYEKGRWAEIIGFNRAANSPTEPSDDGTVFVRGMYMYTTYTGLKKNQYDFDLDFAVAYTTRDGQFGEDEHVLQLNDGLSLGFGTDKTILGYPYYLDYNFADGLYYLHQTGDAEKGYFNDAILKQYNSFYETDAASTGPGNSGGPLLIRDGTEHRLAGILVSGYTYFDPFAYEFVNGAGFYILDRYSEGLAQGALGASDESEAVVGTTTIESLLVLRNGPLLLPDGASRYSALGINLSRLPKFTTKVLLNLDVDATKSSDIDAYLRSPKGRIYVLASADPDTPGSDLKLNDHDVSGAFLGANPGGQWQIFIKDTKPNGSRVTVNSASLRVTSR